MGLLVMFDYLFGFCDLLDCLLNLRFCILMLIVCFFLCFFRLLFTIRITWVDNYGLWFNCVVTVGLFVVSLCGYLTNWICLCFDTCCLCCVDVFLVLIAVQRLDCGMGVR